MAGGDDGSSSGSGHAGHMPATGDRKALIYSGILTGVYFVVEIVVGLWSGSVAVTSDAFHTFSAVGGVLIALVAQGLSERPASLDYTYGWMRAEIIGALFNGVFLIAMAGWVFWMGAMRLADPMELPTGVMLWTAAGGIITELIAFRLLYERQKTNLNLKGAFWHILQTFIGSLIIIVSAVVIRLTGFLEIDPLLGMAFGVALLLASWSILRSSLRVLLQSTPEGFDMERALTELQDIDAVQDIHHPHAWSLTSGRNLFSAHIRVRDYAENGERVLKEATNHLKRHYSVYFSTIQVEEDCLTAEEQAAPIDVTENSAESSRPGSQPLHSSRPSSGHG